jgi:hypothetical protein
VLTLLRKSYSQLPTDNHRCTILIIFGCVHQMTISHNCQHIAMRYEPSPVHILQITLMV